MYTSSNSIITEKITNILSPICRDKKILDVGCNNGTQLKRFIGKTKSLFGVDKIKMTNLFNIKIHDISQGLPYKDNSFNIVICSEVIEHILDTDFLLKEIKRVVKKGDYVLITTPNLVSLENRIRTLFGLQPIMTDYRIPSTGHIRYYTSNSFKNQLKEYFELVRYGGVNFPFLLFNNLIKRIMMYFGDIFPSLCRNVYFLGRKK